MTLRNIVKDLRAKGVTVRYRERADGGIIIKEINGQKFEGATGNAYARGMAGETLDSKFQTRLHVMNPPKAKLSQPVQKALRKAQKAHREAGMSSGTATAKDTRKALKKYGEATALKMLEESYLYAKGFADHFHVQNLLEKLHIIKDDALRVMPELNSTAFTSKLNAVISDMEQRFFAGERFKRDGILRMYECLYDIQHGLDSGDLAEVLDALDALQLAYTAALYTQK